MKRIWFPIIILAVVALIVSVWFYRVFCQVSYGLDFGSLFDAIALVFVAIIFEYAYSRQSSEKRADTDLLLETVKDVKTAIGELNLNAKPCNNSKALTAQQMEELKSAEREVEITVHSVECALDSCKASRDDLQFGKLMDAMYELKEALTDSPYPGPYDGPSRLRIQKAFKAFRDELTRIAFAINHR